ncbi:MAG TPA: hypothetical protein VGF96_15785 [Terracidiphilus sp.]
MPTVEFPYLGIAIDPSDPFPSGQIAKRPLTRAIIRSVATGKRMRCFVCLDSGADHCVFPASFATALGIDILTLKKHLTGGVGSTANPTYYTNLEIFLAPDIQFKSYVGFSPAMDAHGIGLLGQAGFFEYYNVSFNQKDMKFSIETT